MSVCSDGADAADDQGEHGEHPDDRAPVVAVRGKATVEHPQQRGERRATFVADAMNAVTGVGAPWYTSGVHMWNGTAATLKPRPTSEQREPGEERALLEQRVAGEELVDAR